MRALFRQWKTGLCSLLLLLAAAPVAAQEEEIIPKITDAHLAKIFKDLGVTVRKTGSARSEYHYQKNPFKMKLVNYNGKDLMLSTNFRQATLAEINKYNLERKHVRAVLYLGFTALEMNLDCVGGVTESIVRSFIVDFEEEVRAFANYLAK